MEENKVIEIQSYNDIITNSSTEIYSSESNKNLLKTLEEIGIEYFVVKDFNDILDIFNNRVEGKDANFLYDVELGINRTGRRGVCGWNNEYLPTLDTCGYKQLRALGYSDSKIADFYDPIYRACGVYGKVYITNHHMSSLKSKFPGHQKTASKFESLGID